MAAALIVDTACGSSSSRYLANRDEKVYLRVPNSWHDVRLSDTVLDPVEQATSDAKVISKSVVTPQKDAVEQKDLDGESPIATMTVYETTGVFNQQLSASLARNRRSCPYDPLLPGDADEGMSEVIDFDPSPTNAKYQWLSRGVPGARQATGDWQVIVNLSTFFDPGSRGSTPWKWSAARSATRRQRPRSTRSSTRGGSNNEHERLDPHADRRVGASAVKSSTTANRRCRARCSSTIASRSSC